MKPLFLILFLQIIGWSVVAQVNSDPVINPSQQDILSTGSDAYIQQIGTENDAEINQRQRLGHQFNQAIIVQQGDHNDARMIQRGKGNVALLTQTGDGNYYDLVLSGRNNTVSVLQDGDNNAITQRLSGFVGVNVDFTQIGNDNSIIQDLNSIREQEFKITQRGDGLSIQITTDSY